MHLFLVLSIINIQCSFSQQETETAFVSDCNCPQPYDLPICCDTSVGTNSDPSESYLTDYTNPCLAECNGIPHPAQESQYCMIGTCSTNENDEIPNPPQFNPPLSTEFIDDCDCSDDIISPICCIINEDGMKENYDNTCLAECNGILYPYFVSQGGECTLGTCESIHPCGCSPDYDPICCNDVQDFMTICDAECGGIQDVVNECVSGKCFAEYIGGIEIGETGGNEACIQVCDNAEGEDQEVCCDGDKDFMSSCYAVCDGYDANTECVDGVCQPSIEGLFSIGTPQEFSFLNMITIGIQLFILSVCCLGIGCAIPSLVDDGKWGFQFDKMKTMPNFDFKMKLARKEVSYGPDL